MNIWKDIQGYEGIYQINQIGEIKTFDKEVISSQGTKFIKKSHLLKPRILSGYKSINLYSPTAPILRRGFLLPPGKLGFYYNFRIGDTSNYPWTLLMQKTRYTPLNWIPRESN